MNLPEDPTLDQDAIGYLMDLVRAGKPNPRELALAEKCETYLRKELDNLEFMRLCEYKQ